MLGIINLYISVSRDESNFTDVANRCQTLLKQNTRLYRPQYALAASRIGQAICDSFWADESERLDLLAPALEEYRRALEITAAPGVVQDAICDLELIQAAGIEGLEPAFELLENAEYEPDLPEDLPDILEDLLQEDQE